MKNGLPGTRAWVKPFICTYCSMGRCGECIDIRRVKVNLEGICKCPKHKK